MPRIVILSFLVQTPLCHGRSLLLSCRDFMDEEAVGLEAVASAVVVAEAPTVAAMATACQLDTMMHELRMGI